MATKPSDEDEDRENAKRVQRWLKLLLLEIGVAVLIVAGFAYFTG